MSNQVEFIKTEIERRIEINKYADTPGYLKEDKALLQFINTLPQELVSEELEEAAKNCQENLYDGYYSGHIEGYQQAFIAGANWQKEQLFLKEFECDHYRNLNFSSWIAWLEKQGEQFCWIKCSDGLPNRDGTYLVVTDGRHNDVYDVAKYDSIEGWHKSSEIIYWMPIPQLNNKSIIEQKPAWSEEDKKMCQETIDWFEKKCFPYALESQNPARKSIKWLKSLKERMKGE